MLRSVLITIGILLGLFLLYLWVIHPRMSRKKDVLPFTKWDYAHRGLWDLKKGRPENSMPAFRAAVDKHYAIELDVHLTKDRRLVVFHDDTLNRVCGVSGTPEGSTWEELSALSLSGTGEHMPLFHDVLQMVNGQVPILIELKLPTLDTTICSYVYEELKAYHGPYLIESFNPFGLRAYRKLDSSVLTGQLSERYPASLKMNALFKFLSTSLYENVISRPDFIAYNYKTPEPLGFQLNRSLFRAPIFVWTVRSQKDFDECRKLYDAEIFERFEP